MIWRAKTGIVKVEILVRYVENNNEGIFMHANNRIEVVFA